MLLWWLCSKVKGFKKNVKLKHDVSETDSVCGLGCKNRRRTRANFSRMFTELWTN
jgi:hypothetical protein